jgi:alginate O-acetyltransferase complex protein AlgI
MGVWYTVILVALCHAVGASGLWKHWSIRIPAPALGTGYAFALTLALLLAPPAGQTFIYFQF